MSKCEKFAWCILDEDGSVNTEEVYPTRSMAREYNYNSRKIVKVLVAIL